MDQTDRRLLQALQRNAQLTAERLGELLHLSPSQAGRRRQRLEADGVVTSYAARLDPAKLGLGVQAFVQIQMAGHSPEDAKAFQRLLDSQQEVIGAWTLTGDADYLLRLYCRDLDGLNRLVHEVLLPEPSVARVHSQIVMAEAKPDSPLPT